MSSSASRSCAVVREARPLDRLYDPVLVQGSSQHHKPYHPTPHHHQQLHQPLAASQPALLLGSPPPPPMPPHPPALQSLQLRALVTGPGRLAFFKRASRAHQQLLPAGGSGSALLDLSSPQQPHSMLSPFPLPSASSAQPTASHPSLASQSPDDPRSPAVHLGASPSSSVGVQSVMREGWSQTLPYSPDVLLDARPSTAVRELLQLQSKLSFSQGTLPAQAAEVELIEAARAAAEWEAALPPLTSAASYAERQRRVAEREWRDWAVKEESHRMEDERRMQRLMEQMEERQRQRLEALTALKEERSRAADEAEGLSDERRKEQKRRLIRVLGKSRLREERRAAFMTGGLLDVAAPGGRAVRDDDPQVFPLFYPRTAAQGGGGRDAARGSAAAASGDSVFAAVDFSSGVYAPLARSGSVRAQRGGRRSVVDFDIPALSDFDQLAALGGRGGGDRGGAAVLSAAPSTLPQLPQPGRAELQRRRHLQRVDSALSEHKEQLSVHGHDQAHGLHTRAAQGAVSTSTSSSLSSSSNSNSSSVAVNVYKAFCPVMRVATPSIHASAASDAAAAVAVRLLQRLLRGRAAQVRAERGVRKREGLLNELSHAEAPRLLQPDVVQASGASGDAALLDCLLGVLWSDGVLSVQRALSQEAQLQSLTALRLTVDFVRRVRESEEGGRRQAQEERRRAREQHSQRLTSLLSSTVAAPRVLSILHQATQRSRGAEEDAREQSSGDRRQELQDEADSASTLIGSVLDSLLFPCVLQQAEATRAALQQRRLLVAAHDSLHDAAHALTAESGRGGAVDSFSADSPQLTRAACSVAE